jgi:protein O-mannosyl-transferase
VLPRRKVEERRRSPRIPFLLALGLILIAATLLYYPALHGNFIFDDLALPLQAGAGDRSLAGVTWNARPVLMISYRLNGILLGDRPVSYHLVNLLIHVANTCLVFLVFKRLLSKAGWSERRGRIAACAGALVFLIHPLQTESVSYIAGRSESLAALFLLLAYVVFLSNPQEAISWGRSLTVLVLFAVAVKTKENAVSLAGILLLTDLMWPKAFSLEGPRRNWRLYTLMLPGVAAAAVAIFRMLVTAETAGFSVAKYTWYQYAFTEARAIFAYIRLAVAPIGQALDHDFATSHTITQHGAVFYILLLAGLVAAAIRRRGRYPLACFGFLMFLTWLAPTSSIVPVDDALVERRMYLPLMGLILIGCEIGARVRLPRRAVYGGLTATVLLLAIFCHERNRLWGKPELLIALAAKDAQHNPRPLLNVAEELIRRNRCDLAIPYLDRAERILPGSYFVHSIRGRALACLGRFEDGMQQLQLAAQIRPCSDVYQWIGLLYGEMGRLSEAGPNLHKAVVLDPKSAAARGALALWYELTHDFNGAEREYAAGLSLAPSDAAARAGLERVRKAAAAVLQNPAARSLPSSPAPR